MTIAGRVGTAAVFPESLEEGNITGHIVGIALPEDVNPHYIAAFINSQFGDQVTRLSHRTTRPELNLKEVGSILISVPPRSLQDQIAQLMQNAYGDRQRKLAEAKHLFQSMDEWALKELKVALSNSQGQKHFTISLQRSHGRRWDVFAYQPSTINVTSKDWISFDNYV